MKRWLFKTAALVSAILWGFTAALSAFAFVVGPRVFFLSVHPSVHIGVLRPAGSPILGRIALFDDAEFGPYQGSIITLSDEHGNSTRPLVRRSWGDAFGVYYRYFRFLDTGETAWTVTVSLGYPLAIFAVAPALWLWRRRRTGCVAR